MNEDKILENLLVDVKHMVVAVTLDDGTPWAVPVHIKRHAATEFEWDSVVTTEHSQAIAARPQISLTIFSTATDIGFYAKAQAEEVPGSRRENGLARYRATITEAWINEKRTKQPIEIQ